MATNPPNQQPRTPPRTPEARQALRAQLRARYPVRGDRKAEPKRLPGEIPHTVREVQKPARWKTPEREALLHEIALRYETQCLQGHVACANIAHYRALKQETTPKWVRRTVYKTEEGKFEPLPENIPEGVDVWTYVGVPKEKYVQQEHVMGPALSPGDPSSLRDRLGKKPFLQAVDRAQVTDWARSGYLSDQLIHDRIKQWVDEDRERESLEWRMERDLMRHETKGYGRVVTVIEKPGGGVVVLGINKDPTGRDINARLRPQWKLKAIGVAPPETPASVPRRMALAQVLGAALPTFVNVDISSIPLSKNAKRKLRRYGDSPPAEFMAEMMRLVDVAVASEWRRLQPKGT